MNEFAGAVRWLLDPAHWSGDNGIPVRTFEHLYMSALGVGVAALIALPIGMLIGHTGRGQVVAVNAGNLGRALPSFGILALVFPITLRYLPGIGFWPTLIALVLLAVPPILTNTFVGIQGVDRDTVEAARGMGLSGWQVLRRLEIPLAVPLIVAGMRTAAVQVVATATLAALVAWGGLGRYIIDGFSQGDRPQVVAGAILVALLAVLTELAFALVERTASPRTSSAGRRLVHPRPAAAATA